MKVFLIYEEEGQPYHKLAITLPNKWLEQSADKVKECFVERYNKKFPDTPLDDELFPLHNPINYVNWLGTQKKRLQALTASQEGPLYGPGVDGGLVRSLGHR